MNMLVFPQFWMSLKILDEAAKNHTLRIWSAGRLSLFQLVPSCKRIFGQIHRKLAKLSENEKKVKQTSRVSHPQKVTKLRSIRSFTKLLTLTDPTFLGASNRRSWISFSLKTIP